MAGQGKFQTQNDFIKKSVDKHGEIFDYSRVVYCHSKLHVEIGCKVCGHWFLQKPNHNLNGRGCPKCSLVRQSDKMRHSTEEFVLMARLKHGDKYDYPKVDYKGGTRKVIIKCLHHNKEFLQAGAMHLQGQGCSDCYEDRRGDAKSATASKNFVAESENVHGVGTYNYSKVSYISSDSLVTIGCNRCGNDFEQTPSGHKQGYGCSLCSIEVRGLNKRSNTSEFIEKSKAIHGSDKFKYDRVNYTMALESVEIGCQSCGRYWETKATKHLAGFGCSVCADYGFNPSMPATLYVLKFEDTVKVGITNRLPQTRIKEINKASKYNFELVNSYEFSLGENCAFIESILLEYLKTKYSNPPTKYTGYTESFLNVDYEELITKIDEELAYGERSFWTFKRNAQEVFEL